MPFKWVRHGICEPEKCEAACCKSLNITNEEFQGEIITTNICPRLVKDRCSIYKKRPESCREFPNHPEDIIYKKVNKVCTFWFDKFYWDSKTDNIEVLNLPSGDSINV